MPRKNQEIDDLILKRQQQLYRRQTEGLPARALVVDHAKTYGITERHAWNDWNQVKQWNDEDWAKDRENMISRIQAMRLRAIDKAMKNELLNLFSNSYLSKIKNTTFIKYNE